MSYETDIIFPAVEGVDSFLPRPIVAGMKSAALCWQENGDPAGRPVLFCHGWPSSRVLGDAWEHTAARRGWRVITPDRPGIGRSPAQPGRTFGSWPSQAAVLLDSLGIASCPVIGMSGGGPYALACGALKPERFPRVAVLSGAPPLHDATSRALMWPTFRRLAWVQERFPEVMRWGFRVACFVVQQLDIATVRRLAVATAQAPDAALLSEERGNPTLRSGLEAWRGSLDGVSEEGRLYLAPWDFDVENLRGPVAWWHGDRDPLFHTSLVAQVVELIPSAVWRRLPSAGHFTPLAEMQDAVFDWLEAAP